MATTPYPVSTLISIRYPFLGRIRARCRRSRAIDGRERVIYFRFSISMIAFRIFRLVP